MRLMFASGDVGGARALAPVCLRAAQSGHQVFVVRHGAIVTDHADRDVPWTWIEGTAQELCECGIEALAFASSVFDQKALNLAIMAQSAGLPVLHLLDNWSNYRTRLRATDGTQVAPDVYAVMDQSAAQAAQAQGIDPDRICITGTPALAHICPRQTLGEGIVFVSEPVSLDQGRDPADPAFRGYTEDAVLSLFLETLAQVAPERPLWVIPHPREAADGIRKNLKTHGLGTLVTPQTREQALDDAGAIVGMASILLYESWLRGVPTLSLQPEVRLMDLRYLSGRPGLILCDDASQAASDLIRVLDMGRQDPTSRRAHLDAAQAECQRHKDAAQRVLTALTNFAMGC